MKFGKILAVILVIAAFAVGLMLGRGGTPAPVITATLPSKLISIP